MGEMRARGRGSAAVLVLAALPVLLAFIGLVLDLSRRYDRQADLRQLADATALAAARELAGTTAGVTAALARAAAAAGAFRYEFNTLSVNWSSAAIRFGATPDGDWLDAAAAQAAPDGLLFARVDTGALNAAYGTVDTVFMNLLPNARAGLLSARAVAGRSSINVLPLAICALSGVAAGTRLNPPSGNELVEYGFRRGVGYDLMQLNPNGTTPENFVIDPTAPPGVPGSAANMTAAVAGPHVCAGSLPMRRVRGGALTVGRPFPLGALYKQLNSRFDQYADGLCSPASAPPDANIKSYAYTGALPWMVTAPSGQAAKSYSADGALRTVAEPQPGPTGTTAAQYGPLWIYAKAVPISSYVAGAAEPAAGYTAFAASAWPTLYTPGAPTAFNYPATTPYAAYFLAPSAANGPGVRGRRVLNVALLSCPVASGATAYASVLGVARFFMTVPASATSLHAEFAGMVSDQALGGPVELYP